MPKQIFNTLLACVLLTACNTIKEVSIDNLIPGKFNFVAGMDSVAIVNNTTIDSSRDITKEDVTNKFILYHEKSFLQGNPQAASESLAYTLANQKYFHQVIICDSSLRQNDTVSSARLLTQPEIKSLCNDLHANTLISLDNIWLSVDKKSQLVQNANMTYCYGTTDAKVYPVIRIYVPTRTAPLVTLVLQDSIMWESEALTPRAVKDSMPQLDSIKFKASSFAGELGCELIPHWVTSPRYYYSNTMNSIAQEANYYINLGDWKRAQRLWKSQFKSSNGRAKARMAFNIALSYEMDNSLNNAIKWIDEANSIIKTKKKKTNKVDSLEKNINYYKKILQQRIETVSQLKIQMKILEN